MSRVYGLTGIISVTMKVLKFGGTSVADGSAINAALDIMVDAYDKDPLIIVCSAMSGITNLLTTMSKLASRGDQKYLVAYHEFRERHTSVANDLLDDSTEVMAALEENYQILRDLLKGIYLVREVSPRTLDYVLSFGERHSCFLINATLSSRGYNSRYVDARQLIVTDKTFNNATVDRESTNEKIRTFYNETKADFNIVTGFIAADVGGLTTTIGRGGSDYTASLFAAALSASRLDIYTDVDGVLTSDPRKVDTAFTIPELSYAEAMEMSHFGAKVIYPPTIAPALQATVPIYIRNTFNPSFVGTYIGNSVSHYEYSLIKGISALSDVAVITVQGSGLVGVPGISARLFTALAQESINILLITQASSEYSITLALHRKDAKLARTLLEDAYKYDIASSKIRVDVSAQRLSIIAVVGEQMKEVPGVAGRLFESLGQNGINLVAIAQGSSELNISFIIDSSDEEKALNLLHESFFDNVARRYHLYIAGVGLIGSELLEQIQLQNSKLREIHGIDLRVVAVANSKRIYADRGGINISSFRDGLVTSVLSSTPSNLIDLVKQDNLPNSIFIDNTASGELANVYLQMLKNNVSIVTPNKSAASGPYEAYSELMYVAAKKNIDYLYETNVGAGLPIISTIRNMIDSGDEVISIQGVLSGSLSYIFNTFGVGSSFKDVVAEAKELGYTEPDPRDDLSMADVRRKIVILSRVAGRRLDMKDVRISPILPAAVSLDGDVSVFFDDLERQNEYFDRLVTDAEGQGRRLRVIATSDGDASRISLEAVGKTSPFYNLTGSDNMVVLQTQRYYENPLVVKGPGAGAAVTAAGVFSDIISIAKRR